MNEMDIIIESTTKPENPKKGIKFEGNWHTVVGNAANYVKDLKPGKATITLDEKGNVTFIKQEKSIQTASNDPEQGYNSNEPSVNHGNTTIHFVLSDLDDEGLRLALNGASEQYNVFATQTHRENGKWCAIIFAKG